MTGEHHGYMGWWGDMGGPKQRGIVTYSISSYAQKPFAGVLHAAVFNSFRRVSSQVIFFIVPIGIYGYILQTAKARNAHLYSKAGHAELQTLL
ncbi:cytochrome b-c1 complex subunit 8 [Lipomyces oligophaga]|uniref:cytochrome b-c1 complex subunit 8 n=1 Tax=Lipomyces oligophaga TaxID=45792 RepID=UPI0034CEE516